MTLFEFPSQYREKLAIWRIVGTIILYGPLAEGHVFRWFAVNIPMDLQTGGKFTGDIDLIACLRPIPTGNEKCDLDGLIYKTWEVKVSLLHENGDISSLKRGKTGKILHQLQAHRDFGSPDVSLLEVYVLAPDMVPGTFLFPPPAAETTIHERLSELYKSGFGYQVLPFGHKKHADIDVGLFAIPWIGGNPLQTNYKLLSAIRNQAKEPFSILVKHLNEFIDIQGKLYNPIGKKIAFCRACRRLNFIDMKEQYTCFHCGDDFIAQS